MKKLIILLVIIALPSVTRASIAYGSLNNFDVVNDSSNKCYGFEIELDDIHSTDITYTYDYNHYGVPKITEDNTDPLHSKVFVRYATPLNPDGTFASFTNPQDPLNPLPPTGGHAFTDPSVNLGGEHFGVGNLGAPTVVNYHWLIENPLSPGTLALGPAVNVATPTFVYVAAAPSVLAEVQVVIVSPAPEVPVIKNIPQFGVPVWVKVLKTVQQSGKHVKLDELLPNDSNFPTTNNWAGAETPETEIEWQVFQNRPPGHSSGRGEIAAHDNLKNGDETVTRRYEFYVYNGLTDADDGEALCSDTNNCPDAIGPFISAQMAGFNVVTPLGLINHLQNAGPGVPYVQRTLVVGGNTPYVVGITNGVLPDGMVIDPTTGVLSGTPTARGPFIFTVTATDADAVSVTNTYTLTIETSTRPVTLSFQNGLNPWTVSWPPDHLGWHLQIQTNLSTGIGTNWTTVPGSDQTNQFSIPFNPANGSVFVRLIYP